MTQFGFFFDQGRCSGCQTCAVACKSWHGLPPGPLKYLRIYQYETGAFPDVRLHVQWISCYHCEEPACMAVCPNEAIYKEDLYGAVLVDSERCDGCRLCYEACPYGALVFESDEPGTKARKCTMCMDRLKAGDKPICVLACPTRALDFGPMETLEKVFGGSRELEHLPSSGITRPSVLFRPRPDKRPLVPYDKDRALELLMRRDPLPPIFTSIYEVTEIPSGLVGRDKLVIKHASSQELLYRTRNDEG